MSAFENTLSKTRWKAYILKQHPSNDGLNRVAQHTARTVCGRDSRYVTPVVGFILINRNRTCYVCDVVV